ncbi:MAG: SMP-30/gluconolactonase/LRE family protein [candidate division KSB1 bacterium]|nr:SMP-30/gluconolactonase/LRE family protein [candidate division KSB1 bacterium]MDZ7407009.1 SMP-30/gluconolactonase/LRE family protein [candidate division KSB1 bacterium]
MKLKIIVPLFLLLAIAWRVIDTVRHAGEFKTIKPHFSGQCEKISGAVGAEDITIHPQTGVAFISSNDRRALLAGEQTTGAIYAYDLKSETPALKNLTQDFAQPFHPHGISLYPGDGGEASLFVVNHRPGGEFIEIFDYHDSTLVHRESIRGELMTSPNDVVAVGPRSFYVTNDHGNVSQFGRTLEEYLQLARSYVLYYDGQNFKKAAEDLLYANGINVSHDGKTIYVAACTGLKIHLYDRDIASGLLKLKREIPLGTGVDNIELDAGGNLWVAAHPQLLTFTRHAKDAATSSPSEILKISFDEDGDYRIDQIYLNAGEEISGSSVGAVFGQKLLIGSVFEKYFLVCEMK